MKQCLSVIGRFFTLLLISFCVSCSSSSDTSAPFKGSWESNGGFETVKLVLDLYQKSVCASECGGAAGATCYGYMQRDNDVCGETEIVQSVVSVGGDRAEVMVTTYGYDDAPRQVTLTYNRQNGAMVWDGLAIGGNGKVQSGAATQGGGSQPNTWLLLIGGIIVVVICYYLFKILLGYAIAVLVWGLVGALIGGLLIWGMTGIFGAELSDKAMIWIAAIPGGIGALFGLYTGITSTKELANTHLATTIASEMAKTDKQIRRQQAAERAQEENVRNAESDLNNEIDAAIRNDNPYGVSDKVAKLENERYKLNEIKHGRASE